MFMYTHRSLPTRYIPRRPKNITGVRSTTMNVKKTLATIPLYYEHAICTFIIKAIANFKFFFLSLLLFPRDIRNYYYHFRLRSFKFTYYYYYYIHYIILTRVYIIMYPLLLLRRI